MACVCLTGEPLVLHMLWLAGGGDSAYNNPLLRRPQIIFGCMLSAMHCANGHLELVLQVQMVGGILVIEQPGSYWNGLTYYVVPKVVSRLRWQAESKQLQSTTKTPT